MFSGIVQAVGTVVAVERTPSGVRIAVDPGGWDHRPEHGESISVGGCCLTVAAPPRTERRLLFDVVAETLAKTNLGRLAAGAPVNLERSLRAMDLMSGHLVQGHVDGVGTVESVNRGGEWRVRIRPPDALMEYMVPKGSVAVEGVSLTLASLDGSVFDVALIPTTLEKTTLGGLKPGDAVNVEADIIAKTVAHWLRQRDRGTSAAPHGGG